ncbi:MAG: HU family DNA-binding protein [Bacteroidaceae bacterium]
MTSKEFILELSQQMGWSTQKVSDSLNDAISIMTKQLQEDDTIYIQGFGMFEVKKRMERISVNPVSKLRMLVPPKLVLTFKPSIPMKDKFK